MATMSIRGLDDQALARLKHQAHLEGISLNKLVLQLLQNADARHPDTLKKFGDLDTLAGSWTAKEAQTFERNTAAFSEVDPALWK